MGRYRRYLIPGGSYFFTACLQDRRATLLTDRIDALRAAWAAMILRRPLRCEAMVVLPNHLHCVWTLPEGDADYSDRWRHFKSGFSRQTPAMPRSASMRVKGEKGVWQRRFWEHAIRDEADLRAHIAYCWSDPVRHGLVARPADWRFSSLQGAIRRGEAPPDWRPPPELSAFVRRSRFGEAAEASRGPGAGARRKRPAPGVAGKLALDGSRRDIKPPEARSGPPPG